MEIHTINVICVVTTSMQELHVSNILTSYRPRLGYNQRQVIMEQAVAAYKHQSDHRVVSL